jgi:hypothetical protein
LTGLNFFEQDDDVVETADHGNCLRASLAPNAMAISRILAITSAPGTRTCHALLQRRGMPTMPGVGADLKRLWPRICE